MINKKHSPASPVISVNTSDGPAIGVNYGVINYLVGDFSELRHQVIDPRGLPTELGLIDPTDGKPVGMFTGRQDLVNRIDAFIKLCSDSSLGRYLLIEAEAGMGKSALATWLVFNREWPNHFTRIADDPSPEAARVNLGAQLIARWELIDRTPNGMLPPDRSSPAWLTGVLHDAAQAATANQQGPVVILVDGLDEAPTPPPGQLPLGLPRQLPAGVVAIVTSRPGAGLPAGFRPVERIDVESTLNRSDLLKYLERVTAADPGLQAALAQAPISASRFCHSLLDRSGGIWIYALSVLDQIRYENRSPADVDTLPSGLAAYYTNNIIRWHSVNPDRWASELAPLLGALAAAREARTASDLAQWAGINTHRARELVRGPLKAFLITRPGGDPDTYALRHQSLRDFCQGLVSDDAEAVTRETAHDLAEHTTQAHRRIVESLTAALPSGPRIWSHGKDNTYSTAHLAHHAAAAGYLEELVADPNFLVSTALSELLRLRSALVVGQPAVAALEMAANDWPADSKDRLHWLEVNARKMQATALADRIAAYGPHRDWHPIAATWPGVNHRTLVGHSSWVRSAAAVSLLNGRTLLATASADCTVRLWDPANGQSINKPLMGHTGSVWSVATVPLADHRTLLATASADHTVRLWDPATGRAIGPPLTGHTGWVWSVTAVVLAGGRTLLATASADHTVRLWNPANGLPIGSPLTGHVGDVNTVAAVALPDGRTLLATGGADRTVRLWNPITGQAASPPLAGHTGSVRSVAAIPLPNGQTLLATGGDDRTVRLWDPTDGQPISSPFTGHTGSVWSVASIPLPDGRTLLATASDDHTVRLWDPASGQSRNNLRKGHASDVNTVTSVPLSSGRTLLATGGNDHTVRLWDPTSGQPFGPPLTGHTGSVRSVTAVSIPDGRTLVATASADYTARLWDPISGQPAGAPLTGHFGGLWSVVVVPLSGGRTLLATGGDDSTVRLWNPMTSQSIGPPLTGHTGSVRSVTAVSLSDGRTLLATAGADHTVRLWDPITAQPVGDPLVGHTASVQSVTAVPLYDGRVLLATASADHTVRLWDPMSGQPAGPPLTGHTGSIWSVTAIILPGGRTLLATGSDDRTIRLWDPVTSEPTGLPLTGHSGSVLSVAAATLSDSRTLLASASADHTMIVWLPSLSSEDA